MPLKEYFLKIQQCVNALALVSKLPNDYILHILAGLGPAYESMISIISTRTNSLFIQDITSLLLTKKLCIKCTISVECSLPSTNLVAQGLEKNTNQPIKQ